MRELLTNLREDIDLLTCNRQPSPEEMKIVNDISAVIALLKEMEDDARPCKDN